MRVCVSVCKCVQIGVKATDLFALNCYLKSLRVAYQFDNSFIYKNTDISRTCLYNL